MKRLILFIVVMLSLQLPIYAQQHSSHMIHGIVRDASSGQPLTGITLTLHKSHTSFMTNKEGKFSIKLTIPTDSLAITSIGYQEKHLAISQDINHSLIIQLQPTTTHLQEVIVSTGYQEMPKERATGSFEQINKQELNQTVSPNIIDRLKGVSSILFDPKGNRIRGLSTINGPKKPLIIVDNFPYEGDINNINPNDVESVTILKDAAATSIWGTKAGNGVIVIKTKRGNFNKPLQVSFNTNLTITQKPNLSDFHPITSGNFIDVEKYLYSKGFYNSQINNRYKPPLSPIVELLIRQGNGQISKADVNAKINDLRNLDIKDEFKKYIYQTGVRRQYDLNFSGGSQYASYDISGGYDKNINVLAEDVERINLKVANRLKPLRNLSISTQILYTQNNSKTGKPPYNSIYIGSKHLYPYARLADEKESPLPLYFYRKSFIDTIGDGKLLDWKYYPLEDWKHNYTTTQTQDILVNLGLEYQLFSHLDIDLKYQYEKQRLDRNKLQDINSYYTRDLINQYSQIDYNSNDVRYIVPMGGILDRTAQSIQSQDGRLQLSYDNDWEKGHLSAILGGEIREIKNNSNANRTYGYNKDILYATPQCLDRKINFLSGFQRYFFSF